MMTVKDSTQSLETRQKRSNSMKNNKYALGFKQSQETKDKRASSIMKKGVIDNMILNNELLSGIILSDGHLTKPESQFSTSHFGLSFNPKYRELGDVVSKELGKYDIKSTIKFYTRKTGISSYNLAGRRHPNMLLLRNFWYPDGVKIIPKDLIITPKSLAYAFMGDGTSRFTYKNLIVAVVLCTENFTLDDNLLLIDKISRLGVNFRIFKHRGKFRLICKRKNDVYRFMSLVEPHMLECFMYKVKYPLKIKKRHESLWITDATRNKCEIVNCNRTAKKGKSKCDYHVHNVLAIA